MKERYLHDGLCARVSAVVVEQRLHDVVADGVRRDEHEVLAAGEVPAERGDEVFHVVLDEALEDVRAVLLEYQLRDPRLESAQQRLLLADGGLGLHEADFGEDVLQHVVAVHVSDDGRRVLRDRLDVLFLRERRVPASLASSGRCSAG